MATPDSVYKWGSAEALSAANFDKRFLDINHRLGPLEALNLAYEALVGEVNDTVLAQVTSTIDNLRAQLQQITLLQWLTGTSSTPITLTTGNEAAILIDASDRGLFTPGPYSVLQRISDPGSYAVLQSQSYDRASGQYNFSILQAIGGPGPFSDWSVAAIAGSTLAQMAMLNQALALQPVITAARDSAVSAASTATTKAEQTTADRAAVADDRSTVAADRATVASDKANVATNKAAVDAALASIASGPVFRVAGLAGDVTGPALKIALNVAADIAASYSAIVGAAPAQLDTINELAAALGNDANFAATVTAALAAKANASALPSNGKIIGLSYGDGIGF